MPASFTIDFTNPVPLFPLPNCVLLPHATIPLHIFEPRYRKMVREALDSRGLIAMAMLDVDDPQGVDRPPVKPCVCVGYINRHVSLGDGRYNILLQGICRAVIHEEMPVDEYRSALLQPIEPHPPGEDELRDLRAELEQLLYDPLIKQLASISALTNYLSDELPTAALIDLGAMACAGNDAERYAVLSEAQTVRRGQWLIDLLRSLRRTLQMAEKLTPGEAPDYQGLN